MWLCLQAEMVSKALQTQRSFLKMVTTHQEPAQVRCFCIDWRVKGIKCSFPVICLAFCNVMFHRVILTTLPVAKAATGIHACRSNFQPSSHCRASTRHLSLPCLSLCDSFSAVFRFELWFPQKKNWENIDFPAEKKRDFAWLWALEMFPLMSC